MRLDRLMSIVILLLNRDMLQAKDLAERFEVSVRTIYRDIEAINQAGIPIVTYQGMNGGIGLAEGYRLDRSVLNNDELAAIVTALQSISTSYDQRQHELLAEKIRSIVAPHQAQDFQLKSSQILIDYSPWGRPGRLEQKLETLKAAIEQRRIVRFDYSSSKGELSSRQAEPHRLILKGRQWYLQAYCLGREEFRLFKLMRMKGLEQLAQSSAFVPRELPQEDYVGMQWLEKPGMTAVSLCFQRELRHLAEDWFDIEDLEHQPDGTIIVRVDFVEDEWLYGFLLSFGPSLEVLEPTHLRRIIADRASRIASIYAEE